MFIRYFPCSLCYFVFWLLLRAMAVFNKSFHIKRASIIHAKRSFYFSGVKNWNDLPDNILEQESTARYKKGFRKYLLNLQGPNTTPW